MLFGGEGFARVQVVLGQAGFLVAGDAARLVGDLAVGPGADGKIITKTPVIQVVDALERRP